MKRNHSIGFLSSVLFGWMLMQPVSPAYAALVDQSATNIVSLDSGKSHSVFFAGDLIVFTLKGDGAERYLVRDYDGEIVDSGLALSSLTINVKDPGWYKLYVFGKENASAHMDTIGSTTFVILRDDVHFPKMTAIDSALDKTLWGVATAGPQRLVVADSSKPDEAITEIEAKLALEKKYLPANDPLRKRVIIISFSNGMKDLKGVARIVAHFKSSVSYWEGKSAPDKDETGAEFAVSEMKPFYNTVKAVDPMLKVVGPAVSGLDGPTLSWTEDFLKAGGGKSIDAFSFQAKDVVNGDPVLGRASLDNLDKLLSKYNLSKIEKWQTLGGVPADVYGVYLPRLQGQWTMLQTLLFEQYGIPKEHCVMVSDQSAVEAQAPNGWENEDGSLNPAVILMRVWSEELFGLQYGGSYDLGATGNKLYLASYFSGNAKRLAVFMSTGSTEGTIDLSVTGGTSLHTVSAFGVIHDFPVTAGHVSLPISELPTYVEPTHGQNLKVPTIDWGPNLAAEGGVTVEANGDKTHPFDPTIQNDLAKIHNGLMETSYFTKDKNDNPWMSNVSDFPVSIEIRLPQPTTINHVIIYASPPWQMQGSLLDYQLQYDSNGVWTTLEEIHEPTKIFPGSTPGSKTSIDCFYSDRWIFPFEFASVTTQRLRLVINGATWGGGATGEIRDAQLPWGSDTAKLHQAVIREIEIYEPSGGGTGLRGFYYRGEDFNKPKLTRIDPTVNFDWDTKVPSRPFGLDTAFSVRWMGQVIPPYTGAYTFYTLTDDGVKMWVDGKQIIDNWTLHGPTENSGNIFLEAGQKYDIRIRYYENGVGEARALLSWACPGLPKEIIPARSLYPTVSETAPKPTFSVTPQLHRKKHSK